VHKPSRLNLLATIVFSFIFVGLSMISFPEPQREGSLWRLPDGRIYLHVQSGSIGKKLSLPDKAVLLGRFPIPNDVTLESSTKSQQEMEKYILGKYLSAYKRNPSQWPSRRTTSTSLSGPPRISFVVPSSGPVLSPIVIAGTGLVSPTQVYFGPTKQFRAPDLFGFSQQSFPLIGTLDVANTLVPTMPTGSTVIYLENFMGQSSPYPFTVQ
jgi:hypothetical protein